MPATAFNFIRTFLAVAAGLTAIVWLIILLLDPYGVSPIRLPIARPIMDINQRYMYPQIVRSKAFDSVVIGTSTSRLLDPAQLDKAFGGTFANLAMNAATAWEQTELAKLYLRHQPTPKTLIIGLDQMWCVDEKSLVKVTFRGFPEWMYDENPWNDLPELLSTKTLEITGRLAAFHVGLMPERIRKDGYEVFTPPETGYDPERARFHIWKGFREPKVTPVIPPVALKQEDADKLHFPALVWLEELLHKSPASAQRILAFMPLHVAAQPVPGSLDAAQIEVCKGMIAGIARKHGVKVVDFSIPSQITTQDANYWDPLHYRLPIAGRIIDGLKAAAETGRDAPDGIYKIR
jgi:hypothetical protein